MGDDRIITIAAGQVCCNLDGEAVTLSLKTGQYYGLNDVGARVWTLIQQPKTMSELVRLIRSEFDVDAERCEQDLCSLVQGMSEAGLVEIGGSHGRPLSRPADA